MAFDLNKLKQIVKPETEERAFEAYPDYRAMDGGYVSQRKAREMFSKGYHQAEKDLALSWKDLKKIGKIQSGIYEEVAKGKTDFYRKYPTEKDYY